MSPSLPPNPPVPASAHLPPIRPIPSTISSSPTPIPALTPPHILLLFLAVGLSSTILFLLCVLLIPNFVPPRFIRAFLQRFPSLHRFLHRFPVLPRILLFRHVLSPHTAENGFEWHALECGDVRPGEHREANPWSPLASSMTVSPDTRIPAALVAEFEVAEREFFTGPDVAGAVRGGSGERSPPPPYEVGEGEGHFVVGEDEDENEDKVGGREGVGKMHEVEGRP